MGLALARRFTPLRPSTVVNWAVGRWHAEVASRPLQNVHRRTLDDTWRQVIRQFGGDDTALCGPTHDELVSQRRGFTSGLPGPRDPLAEPAEQFNEFCKEPPCAGDACRKAKRCLHND